MDPFGIQFGRITYQGPSSLSANMTGAWSPRSLCSTSSGGAGWFLVQLSDTLSTLSRDRTVIHELAHAYFGAPDYADAPSCYGGTLHCAFLDCSTATTEFSAPGKDAARYWALIDLRSVKGPY